MNKKYTRIIEGAFQAVLETISGSVITEKSISEGESVPEDIMVMIGMEGDVDGHVYMSVSAQVGKEIASSMLGGIELENADEIIVSAVSEICNMVMGNACIDINGADTLVDIKPPVVVPEYEASHMHNMCNIKITLDRIGNAQLDMSFADAV